MKELQQADCDHFHNACSWCSLVHSHSIITHTTHQGPVAQLHVEPNRVAARDVLVHPTRFMVPLLTIFMVPHVNPSDASKDTHVSDDNFVMIKH